MTKVEKTLGGIGDRKIGAVVKFGLVLRGCGNMRTYKRIGKKNDLLYLNGKDCLQLCQDAGVFNRNAKKLLEEKLDTRDRCGDLTGYVIGRKGAVVFIESPIDNVINDAMMNWVEKLGFPSRLRMPSEESGTHTTSDCSSAAVSWSSGVSNSRDSITTGPVTLRGVPRSPQQEPDTNSDKQQGPSLRLGQP